VRMFKLFGFRITPFFFFILSVECLSLLVCIYLGIILHNGTATYVSSGSTNILIYFGIFLSIFLFTLTPGILSEVKVMNHIKKTFNDKITGVIAALLTMLLIVFSNADNLEAKTIFAAALLSACVGLTITKVGLLGKYWRSLIYFDVN